MSSQIVPGILRRGVVQLDMTMAQPRPRLGASRGSERASVRRPARLDEQEGPEDPAAAAWESALVFGSIVLVGLLSALVTAVGGG